MTQQDIVFKTRSEWDARPAKRRQTIGLPTPELWLHHTGSDYQSMRSIQDYHLDVKKWWDIGYSYVVNPSTLDIFIGRGSGIQGGHTQGHNTISHGICVMGNFNNLVPTTELITTLADLVRWGHKQGWWPNHFTGGHRDVGNTECPGNNLYPAIQQINQLVLAPVESTESNGFDRLAARMYNLEAFQTILWAYSFYHGKTPSRETLNKWLIESKEEGMVAVVAAIQAEE